MDTETMYWWIWITLMLLLMSATWTVIVCGKSWCKGVRTGRIEGYRFAKKPWDEELGNVAGSLGDVIQDGDYRQHKIGCDLSIHPAYKPVPGRWRAKMDKCRGVEYRDIPTDSHYDVAQREWTMLCRSLIDELDSALADLHTCPDCKENCKGCQCYEEREAGYQRRIAELEREEAGGVSDG